MRRIQRNGYSRPVPVNGEEGTPAEGSWRWSAVNELELHPKHFLNSEESRFSEEVLRTGHSYYTADEVFNEDSYMYHSHGGNTGSQRSFSR